MLGPSPLDVTAAAGPVVGAAEAEAEAARAAADGDVDADGSAEGHDDTAGVSVGAGTGVGAVTVRVADALPASAFPAWLRPALGWKLPAWPPVTDTDTWQLPLTGNVQPVTPIWLWPVMVNVPPHVPAPHVPFGAVVPAGRVDPTPMFASANVLAAGLVTVKVRTLVDPVVMEAGLNPAEIVGAWKTPMLAVVELPSATSDFTFVDWSWMTPGWLVGMPMPPTWQMALGEMVAPTSDTLFPEVVRVPPQIVRGELDGRATEKKAATLTEVRVFEGSGFLMEKEAVTWAETGAWAAENAAEI